MRNSSTFYIVATPIGNIGDITIRALETLKSVSVIVAEDTREVTKILTHHGVFVTQRLISYTDYNRNQRIPEVVSFLENGADVALVSDRGLPLVSDPGYKLVKKILVLKKSSKLAVDLEVIPGASAVMTALVLSGLPPDKFYFVGFMPKKPQKIIKLLRELPSTTIIAFETPFNLATTLELIQKTIGNVDIAVCREMTKLHEEVFRGSVDQATAHFTTHSHKGEITLVFRKGN